MSFSLVFEPAYRQAETLGHVLTRFERVTPKTYKAYCSACRAIALVRPVRPAGAPAESGMALHVSCFNPAPCGAP